MKSHLVIQISLLGLLSAIASAAPLSGTKSVGPTGNYASLTAAIANIQITGNGLGGALVLELLPTYVSTVETFPLSIPALNGASAANTLTIRPASGATGLSISSADTTAATVDLNGAQFVTFDGRPGGVGSNAGTGGGAASQLTIANTSTGGAAVRFINEASGITLRYTTLRGVNTSASSGTVVFSTTTGVNGNDNNTIDHCDIRDGPSTPVNGLYSLGTTTTAANNSGNTISNCNIFNFYGSTATDSAGVRLEGGNTDWTIAGNSFYQTVSRVAVAANVRAIYINTTSGNNFAVTGNFIGGSAASAGGAPWTTTGTVTAYVFQGIRLNVGKVTPSSVQGNTIANVIWTSSSNAILRPGVWCGIYLELGSANIGTVTGNTIGSGSGTGSISVTTSGTGGTSFGIAKSGNDGMVAIANNTIGSITVNGSNSIISTSLTGIQVSNGLGTTTVTSNLIGSTSTVNSLNAATSSTSATGQQVTGILFPLGGIDNIITANTVANLNNNYAGTASTGQIGGIVISGGGTNTITGNTIRNLSTTSQNTLAGSGSSALGIYLIVSTTTRGTVSQNVVHSIANTAATANVSVVGIAYAGSSNKGQSDVARNLVHGLSIASTGTASQLVGMDFSLGTFVARNNMVRVGLDAGGVSTAGASSVMGIFNRNSSAGRSFFHNSVYICGTQSSGASNTFALASSGASNARDFRNNILVNARTNSGGSGKHYAVQYGGTGVNSIGLTGNSNIFFVNATGGVLGNYDAADYNTLAVWQTVTGQDSASLNADPLFVAPLGGAATLNLHLQANSPAEGAGVEVGVTDDFDGQIRSALSPVDIGADAGDFGLGIAYPLLGSSTTANRVLAGWASINGPSGISSGASAPRLNFKKTTEADVFGVPNNSTGNGWKFVTASSASNPYSFTIDYALLSGGGVSNGDKIEYFVVAQDAAGHFRSAPYGATASASPPVQNVNAKPTSGVNRYTIEAPLGGTLTVGPGGSFPNLSGSGGLFAALNSRVLASNLTVKLAGDTIEDGSTSLNAFSSDSNYPPTVNPFTVTIQPDSATMRTISGAGANGLLCISGAQGVTIDGSFGGTGRYLTLRNTSSSGASLIFVNDACNNVVRNCVVEGAATNAAVCVVLFSKGLLTGNDNNIVAGNQIRDRSDAAGVPASLVCSEGSSDGLANSGNMISDNELFNFTTYGVTVAVGSKSWDIARNTIYQTVARTNALTGIDCEALGSNTVRNNMVHDLTTSGTASAITVVKGDTTVTANRIWNIGNSAGSSAAAYGMRVQPNGDQTVTVVNNMVTLGSSGTTAQNLYGIQDIVGGVTTGTVVTVFNTVLITGTGGAGRDTWAFNRVGNSTAVVKNNVFLNLRTGGGNHFASTYANSPFGIGSAVFDYNTYTGTGLTAATDFFDSKSGGNFTGTPISYAQWQASVPGDTHSSANTPGGNYSSSIFVDATNCDLHLVPGGNALVNAAGTPIAGVSADYDGDPRSSTTPSIGSDEARVPDLAVAQSSAIADGGSIDFGTVMLGSSSALVFTITNPGSADLTGLAFTPTEGTNPGDFTVSALSGTSVPASGGSVTFTVSFTPGAGGARSAAVHIASNVLGAKSPFDIVLNGTGQTAFEEAFNAWATVYGVPKDPQVLGASGIKNLLNFAFGVTPVAGGGGLQYSGTFAGSGTITATGQPIAVREARTNGVDRRALFVRRTAFATLGVAYVVQLSADLNIWIDNNVAPMVLADNGTNQIVSVSFPPNVGAKEAWYFRVRVTLAQ